MPRRRVAAKREVLADPKYGSQVLTKFMNHIMLDGKKSVAEHIVYGALDKLFQSVKTKPKAKQLFSEVGGESDEGEGGDSGEGSPVIFKRTLKLFESVLNNIKPTLEVKSRRVGGSTYQVPIEVRPARAMALAMRWVVECASKRSEKTMMDRLAAEMIEAFEGRGAAVKKREDMHKMAKANQAFAHFRW